MAFLILLAAFFALGRFYFGYIAPSPIGTFEAAAHIFAGAVLTLAFLRGRPLLRNPFLWLLLIPSTVELLLFLFYRYGKYGK